MNKGYKIEDIKSDGFIHSRIYEFVFDPEKKSVKINFGFADLKKGGAIVDCTIAITDWWDFEVIEKGKNVFKKYPNNDTPTDIEQILEYEYDENTLTLKACGYLDIDSVIYYKFIKPKIQITGEYDPD